MTGKPQRLVDGLVFPTAQVEKVIGDDQYVSTESEFEQFVNENVPDPREEAYEGLREKGNEEPYQG